MVIGSSQQNTWPPLPPPLTRYVIFEWPLIFYCHWYYGELGRKCSFFYLFFHFTFLFLIRQHMYMVNFLYHTGCIHRRLGGRIHSPQSYRVYPSKSWGPDTLSPIIQGVSIEGLWVGYTLSRFQVTHSVTELQRWWTAAELPKIS